MKTKIKTIIVILGFFLIVAAQAIINLLFSDEYSLIISLTPLWVVAYFAYIKLVIIKHFKIYE